MNLEVRLFGDPVLRATTRKVEAVDDDVRTLVSKMLATMVDEEGIGLAAPQVGKNLRLLVIDGSVFGGEEGKAYINPEILEFSKTKVLYEEGCLSIPDIRAEVERPEAIRLTYSTLEGEVVEEEADELLARVLQHEIDHLEGILFVDRISAARRNLLRKKLRAIQQRAMRS